MTRYTLCQWFQHIDQCIVDAIAWHRAVNPNLTQKQVEAYRAGFRAGAQASRGLFVLHAGIDLPDRPVQS